MNSISLEAMREYLSRSMHSGRGSTVINRNKLNGMLAEIDFRNYISSLGFGDRVSMGGWILRNEGPGVFGHYNAVIFPEIILPGNDYGPGHAMASPPIRLHSICAIFHQIGINSYFCRPIIACNNDLASIEWICVELGLPSEAPSAPFPSGITGFNMRRRRHNFLTNHTDVAAIPNDAVPEEFSKEHLRVTFQNSFLSEISDVDGVFWGSRIVYPIEIKEKTPAPDNKLGDYFGIDIGPFVKLAFYASKRGDLHSLFVVREIDNVEQRNLVNWWYITFDKLAQYASWNFSGGGRNMLGGASAVVKIPKSEFRVLNREALDSL